FSRPLRWGVISPADGEPGIQHPARHDRRLGGGQGEACFPGVNRMNDFNARIQQSPVVAAVSDLSRLAAAIQSPSEIIFLLMGTILTEPQAVREVQAAGKAVYIHLDLVEGFSRDLVAREYIKKVIKPDGIITTR